MTFEKIEEVREFLSLVGTGVYSPEELSEALRSKGHGIDATYLLSTLSTISLYQKTFPNINVSKQDGEYSIKISYSDSVESLTPEEAFLATLVRRGALSPESAVEISTEDGDRYYDLAIALDRGYIFQEDGKYFIPEIMARRANDALLKLIQKESEIDNIVIELE